MTMSQIGLRLLAWLALALCVVRLGFFALIVFVMPDPECLEWGLSEYAMLALSLYVMSLLVIAIYSPKSPAWIPVLLGLSLVGVAASYFIWDLPQQRVRCDGTVFGVPSNR